MTRHGEPGQSALLGATVVDGGVNFSLFSRSETAVERTARPAPCADDNTGGVVKKPR